MAGASLLTLLDDIATVLDDIAVMSKVAAKKTAGVLGDDLALNAQQVSGIRAERELPVVWQVAKGSFINKLILVPIAIAISAILPWLIQPLLMIGGAYLCFEGAEKIIHSLLHRKNKQDEQIHKAQLVAIADPTQDMVAFEKSKIKGAIRTDFILSAEIIVIALGTVAAATLTNQILVVGTIAIAMTVGVYGLVALIVKLDDMGLYLTRNNQAGLLNTLGTGLLWFAPQLMKTLSVVGTAAMFLVGGSILVHGMPFLHHVLTDLNSWAQTLGALATISAIVLPLLFDFVVGLVLGSLVVFAMNIVSAIKRKAMGN
ncbi:MAG: putative DNA repair protein MutK [Oceanicoccus sp.]|jgi:predicted DNA repair protein MutK